MTRALTLLFGLSLLLAAALPAEADETVITGSVVYRERMLLPPGAEATVQLEDVSLADSPATILAEVTVPATTSPTPFTLPYTAALEAGHRYALRASISAGGELMFATADHVAFDGTQPDGIELLVQRTGGEAAAQTIVGSWLAEDIGGGGVVDNLQSTITIATGGAVSGNSGCNGFGGMSTIEGDKITFGPLAGTLMACSEAIMDQERKFYDALARTASFSFDESGKLVLHDAAGTALVRFSAN